MSLTILAQTKQRKPSTGLGHPKPSSPAAPSCKQQPDNRANRTPLFRLSADILHIPPPPRISLLKIRAPKSPSPPPFREANLAAQATPHNQLRAHSLSHRARPCPRGQVTSENESGPSKAALTPLKVLTPLKGVCLDSFFEVGDCGRVLPQPAPFIPRARSWPRAWWPPGGRELP